MVPAPLEAHRCRVAVHRWLSRALAAVLLCLTLAAIPVRAHEVQPAIGDLTLTGDRLTFDVTLALEPLIAGADLQALENTDASARAPDIDRLPAGPLAELCREMGDGV